MKRMKHLLLLSAVFFLPIAVNANEDLNVDGIPSDRIYIDCDELDSSEDRFRIHMGQNIWMETSTIHRDTTGVYTFESNIERSPTSEYVKTWKCPYCFRFWPLGTACQNRECPSKYQ